ncbi:MAG: hypothetical protein ACI4V3_03900 [Faecousia sp.]
MPKLLSHRARYIMRANPFKQHDILHYIIEDIFANYKPQLSISHKHVLLHAPVFRECIFFKNFYLTILHMHNNIFLKFENSCDIVRISKAEGRFPCCFTEIAKGSKNDATTTMDKDPIPAAGADPGIGTDPGSPCH